MANPLISFCIIAGQEECHAERFLASFADAFDELCLVRAIGNQPHDRTVSICKQWCEKHGKDFKFAEYRNAGWREGLDHNLAIDDNRPETWKHVDDFAGARNMAWSLATGDWQLWADLDDVLAPDSAEIIRKCATDEGRYDGFLFKYAIRTSGQSNLRERMFRCGKAHWVQPMHENCRVIGGEDMGRLCGEERVVFSHEPMSDKPRDPDRNRRIMAYHTRFTDAFSVELHREAYFRWQGTRTAKDAETATHWAEVAQCCNILPEQRMEMFLAMAEITAHREDYEGAIEMCWAAMRVLPWRRDPWGWMAEYEIKRGNARRAVFLSENMGKLLKLQSTGMPVAEHFYSWRGLDLHLRANRCAGQEERARKIETAFFKEHGQRFSLLHATRGRPEMALRTRDNFLKVAVKPLGVEHIFAIDEDDTASLEALKLYRHVVVKNPRGCVKAWNTAASASSGHILIQLSDDWLPCLEWDEKIWAKMDVTKSQVLAIGDNHRTDALLCCAILTRARYEAQGSEVFSPEYFGVFSDNEFTVRAYKDGVVVDARNEIVFAHEHPVFEGKPVSEWDATYRRQNAPERYAEGEAIFKRRNPT